MIRPLIPTSALDRFREIHHFRLLEAEPSRRFSTLLCAAESSRGKVEILDEETWTTYSRSQVRQVLMAGRLKEEVPLNDPS